MFDRGAQVNAKFAGSTSQQGEIVAALRALGLEAGQITVLAGGQHGDWQQAATPGLLARLRGRLSGPPAAVRAAPADTLIMAHLGRDDALATPVQDLFRRFGATTVDYYPPGRVATRIIGDGAVDEDEAAVFRRAFPEGDQRGERP